MMNNNDKKYLIIYHKEDNDGLFSCGLLYYYLTNELNANTNNIELLGADYNDLNKISKDFSVKDLHEKYDILLMADISFNNIDYIKELYKEFEDNFIWCDHHAPVIKLANRNNLYDIPGIRNIKQSALLCVYDYLYNPFGFKDERLPELFKILSAWDSFTFSENGYTLDYVRNINVGVLNVFNLNIDKVISFVNKIMLNEISDLDTLITTYHDMGSIINNYLNFNNENILREQGDFEWKIYNGNVIKIYDETDNKAKYTDIPRPAVALFIQGPSSSLMFKSLDLNTIYQNGIVFKRNKDSSWSISLYNIQSDELTEENGGFHCGKFMQKYYNGGGHMGAAGCTVSEEEFLKILKNKYLGQKTNENIETTDY